MMKILNLECEGYMKTLSDGSVNMIITDPPYGINYKSNKQLGNTKSGVTLTTRSEHFFQEIQNDETLPTAWVIDAFRILKDNSAMYVFLHWSKWSEMEAAVKRAGFNVKGMIVINKSNHGMGDLNGGYAPKHELLMYCAKGKHKLNRAGGRKKDVFDLPVKFSGAIRLHPNEKPLSWLLPFIEESSNKGDLVFDPFCGSASSGDACKKLERDFIGCEVDAIHYATACKRLSLNGFEKAEGSVGQNTNTLF